MTQMLLGGSVNGGSFLAYRAQVRAHELRPGNIVVMDNLPTHKISVVSNAFEKVGIWLVLLPPNSPEFTRPCSDYMQSPIGQRIEMAFSKLKPMLRMAAARTVDEL